MDQIRTMLATVRKYLGQLTPTHKLLMASLAVILAMTLAFVALYAGKARAIELLKGYPADDQQRAAAFLTAANIPNELKADGKLYVPADRETQARTQLAENGKLPSDKRLLFDNLIEKQSWINSRQQNDQIYLIALQNQLASDIGHFKGIKSATVILDIPEAQGFGRSVRKPSASATVISESGQGLTQPTVDAVAGYIAGSRAGLEVERVRVIDASTGRQRKPSNETDMVSATYLEHAAKVESQTQEKISDLLRYIPGVIVAVTAQVDVTRVDTRTTTQLKADEGTLVAAKRTTEESTNSKEAGAGGEAGLMSNVAADINRGASAGAGSTQEKTDKEFEIHPGTRVENKIDPKGMPTMVAVSVNVPHGFVADLLKNGGTAVADEKAIADKFDKEIRPKIEAAIRPHVRTMTTVANGAMAAAELDKLLQDSISVAMIPIDLPVPTGTQTAGLLGGLALSGGFGGGILDKAIMGLLAVLALGMMFVLVKRASKKVEMPTAEELVGLPPALETPTDVIGEAAEGDTAMTGIEVGDEVMQSQKMLEQVETLVTSDPQQAARLIGQWLQTGE